MTAFYETACRMCQFQSLQYFSDRREYFRVKTLQAFLRASN